MEHNGIHCSEALWPLPEVNLHRRNWKKARKNCTKRRKGGCGGRKSARKGGSGSSFFSFMLLDNGERNWKKE